MEDVFDNIKEILETNQENPVFDFSALNNIV